MEAPQINEELLQAPVSASLLVPCRVAYPLRLNDDDTTLKSFYEVLAYNLGQVDKCYSKDEALIKEIKEREDNVGTN